MSTFLTRAAGLKWAADEIENSLGESNVVERRVVRELVRRCRISGDEAVAIVEQAYRTVEHRDAQFNKFDWLSSLPAFGLSPGEYAAAIVVFSRYNSDVGAAWPGQESFAIDMCVSDPRKVRTAIARLKARGLIETCRIADLSPEKRKVINRPGRGVAYIPTMSKPPLKLQLQEPARLATGKIEHRRNLGKRTPGSPHEPDLPQSASTGLPGVRHKRKGTVRDNQGATAPDFSNPEGQPMITEFEERLENGPEANGNSITLSSSLSTKARRR